MVKPKVSTGYLTPQGKKTKPKNPKETSQDAEMNGGIDEGIFQALMNDPAKKKAIMQLLKENKKAIDDYRKKEESAKVASPTDKVKKKERHMESPTALLRRRALEKMHGSPCSCAPSDTTPTSSMSRCSSPNCITPLPFEKVLDSVVAYLDIKNRQGEDKSAGAKSVLKSMGAKIRDTFTSDVTHVVFKDGSLSTYQKAKSRNIHLVSILWVEFCRKSSQKQSERLYPALRSAFDDESMICSQMEKDYEEIIRDEYKKSLTQGIPLPSTKTLIDRRRTLMTPSLNSSNSAETFHTAKSQNSENSEDKEVAEINGFSMSENLHESESLVMNDPENFSQVENTENTAGVLASLENTDMDLTTIPETQSIKVLRSSNMDVSETEINEKRKSHRRRTICSSFMSSSNSTLSGLGKENSFVKPRRTLAKHLEIEEEESFVISKNCAKGQSLSGDVERTASAMSVLKISSEFSLRLTQNSEQPQKRTSVSQQLFSDSFTLHVSSEKPAEKSKEFSSPGSSKSSLGVEEIITSLESPVKKTSGRDSTSSNDSEVLIPTRGVQLNEKALPVVEDESAKSRGRRRTLARKTLGPAEVRRGIGIESFEQKTQQTEPSITTRSRRRTLGPQNVTKNLPEPKAIPTRTRRKTMGPQQVTPVEPSKSPTDKNPTDTSDSSPNDGSTRSKSRKRRLYRPGEDILLMEINDDVDRQQRRQELQTRKRKPNEAVPLALPLGEIMKPQRNQAQVESTSSDSEAPAVTPPKRNKKKAEKVRQVTIDASQDEQKELLEEVLQRKKREAEQQSRSPKKPSSRKPKPNELQSRTPSTKKRSTKLTVSVKSPVQTQTQRNRRSTLDYMSKSQIASHMKKMCRKGEKVGMGTIVCTKCHRADVQLFSQIVKKLGKFIVEDEVTNRTTHLIAGEPKRTVNMLRGLVRGCWILKYDWLLRSLEEGKWLPEEDFEVTEFSPAVQKCRLERQAFGSKYTMDVFESCPPIYVALSTTPRCSDLRELITTCKGKIVRLTKLAQIVVGQYCEGAVCVNESWVLDSITFYKMMPFKDKYLIKGEK